MTLGKRPDNIVVQRQDYGMEEPLRKARLRHQLQGAKNYRRISINLLNNGQRYSVTMMMVIALVIVAMIVVVVVVVVVLIVVVVVAVIVVVIVAVIVAVVVVVVDGLPVDWIL